MTRVLCNLNSTRPGMDVLCLQDAGAHAAISGKHVQPHLKGCRDELWNYLEDFLTGSENLNSAGLSCELVAFESSGFFASGTCFVKRFTGQKLPQGQKR